MLDYHGCRRIISSTSCRKRKVTNKLMKNASKYLLLLALMGFFVGAAAIAGKAKVGIVKDGWYSDSRFGFSLAIPQEWKEAGIKDEPNSERLVLAWRKPRPPLKLRDNPNEALKPFARFYADSTSVTALEFFDSLRVGSTKDNYRDKILSKSTFFERGLSNPPEISPVDAVKIGGRDAYRWYIRREYSVQIQKDEVTPPQLVRDYRTGYVYVVPGDGWILYLEMACENQFRDDFEDEFKKIAFSINFHNPAPAADSAAAAPGGTK